MRIIYMLYVMYMQIFGERIFIYFSFADLVVTIQKLVEAANELHIPIEDRNKVTSSLSRLHARARLHMFSHTAKPKKTHTHCSQRTLMFCSFFGV